MKQVKLVKPVIQVFVSEVVVCVSLGGMAVGVGSPPYTLQILRSFPLDSCSWQGKGILPSYVVFNYLGAKTEHFLWIPEKAYSLSAFRKDDGTWNGNNWTAQRCDRTCWQMSCTEFAWSLLTKFSWAKYVKTPFQFYLELHHEMLEFWANPTLFSRSVHILYIRVPPFLEWSNYIYKKPCCTFSYIRWIKQ